MYRYENEQLFKIQFAIFAVEALTNLDPNKHKLLYAEQKYQDIQSGVNLSQQQPQKQTSKPSVTGSSTTQFVSTLYVGFYKNNLYALPALVYSWQSLSLSEPSPPLLTTGEQANDTDTG
jgi:hypothetical protein